MTNSTLIEALGVWLKTFAWDWYFTGTFAKPVTVKGAMHILSEYVRSLTEAAGTDATMCWFAETGQLGGNVHVHGLIGNVGTLKTFCGCEWRSCTSHCGVHLWRFGKAEISPYRNEGAASFYISKAVFTRKSSTAEWGFIGTPNPINKQRVEMPTESG